MSLPQNSKVSSKASKAFTLIELLIVIVIISILAGVLIALIDPAGQQNRARDANIQAVINKAALNAEGYRSAYGVFPTGAQFLAGLDNAAADPINPANCTAGNVCTYAVTGIDMPLKCRGGAANWWWGDFDDATLCRFRYERRDEDADLTYEVFYIWARSYGQDDATFQYASNDAAITNCGPITAASDLPC